MTKKTSGLRPLPGDWILLCLLSATGLLLTGFLYLPGALSGAPSTGDAQLEIYVDGALQETLPLSEETEKTVSTSHGTNTFRIRDGAASMTEANCGDHTCIRTGGISRAGETIVCLPHRLVLRIADGDGKQGGAAPAAVVR